MEQIIRGRFAPSPSGRMHLGNVFCALLAWLSAKAAGGEMVLRIEDLDIQRCKPEYIALLLDDLQWLGLTWDEGGSLNAGPFAPYHQSACDAIYEQAMHILAQKALVYPCTCTRQELHAASAPHLSDGTVLYSGRCRPQAGGLNRMNLQARAALRIAVPDTTITFVDGNLGPQQTNLAASCGDFVLRRSDGVFAYQLAVVADDARMGITQVVRGSDLLSSTARQLWLYELLCAPPPQFFHVPLLCAPDGRRLSKREKDLDLAALRTRVTAPQLIGGLASLAGLVPQGTACMPQELLSVFSWDKVPKRDIIVPENCI